MGANCHTDSFPTIENNILNHTRLTSIAYYHDYLGNTTAHSGIPYVLGETNSISCQGTPGISDVFAAALWSVDYVLYMASLKVTRVFFHGGSNFYYSAWQPIEYNGTDAHVKTLYYGNLVVAKALSGGDKQVAVVANETLFSAYGIYDAHTTNLESVVVTNLAMWNSTETGDRPYTSVKLGNAFARADVRRLTSPGVEIAENITFAGQYVDADGHIQGKETVEAVTSDGTVLVAAGEAVLVSLGCKMKSVRGTAHACERDFAA